MNFFENKFQLFLTRRISKISEIRSAVLFAQKLLFWYFLFPRTTQAEKGDLNCWIFWNIIFTYYFSRVFVILEFIFFIFVMYVFKFKYFVHERMMGSFSMCLVFRIPLNLEFGLKLENY